jgi:hypothetical protein
LLLKRRIDDILSEQEWQDLAFICSSYRIGTEDFVKDEKWDDGLKRRRALANRIIEAAE